MSSRAVKKLYGDEDLRAAGESDSDDGDEPVVQKKNPFEMLGGDSDDDESEEESKPEPEPEPKVETTPVKSKPKKKSKSKKKKNKKQQPSGNANAESEEDIDQLIAEVQKADLQHRSTQPDYFKLLQIDTRYLDYEFEFRKLFGKDAMDSTTDGGSSIFPSPTSRPKDWGGRDGRQVPGSARKLVFSKVKPHFLPTLKREIMMEQVHEIEDEAYGTKSFKFVHTDQYAAAQRLFQYLLPISDPQTVINQVLPKSFYHTPTLLMLAENMTQGGQHSEAADMIERCLLVFDRAFKNSFVFDGSCRLPFKYMENRAFYLVLMKHLKSLMRRGTWTTAFEYAKFLWSLSPELDPYGVGNMIDFFAINAGREKYILELCENEHLFSQSGGSGYRPNLLYSRALAYYILNPTDHEQTKQYMKQAVAKLPWVASQLLDNTFYYQDRCKDPQPLSAEQQILTGLYVVQMKGFWAKHGLISMLAQVVDSVELDPVSQSDSVSPDTVRYALVSEQKEVFSAIPKEYLDGVMWADDLVPPEDDINPYPPRRDLREFI